MDEKIFSRLFFREILGFHNTFDMQYRDVPYTPYLCIDLAFAILTSPPRAVHWLRWHIRLDTSQSPRFLLYTVLYSRCCVSYGLKQMICIHHYRIILEYFHCPTFLCVWSLHLLFPKISGNHWSFCCFYVCCLFSHSVMSYCLQPMDCGPPGSSICAIFQTRILEWFAISYSRQSSQPRD